MIDDIFVEQFVKRQKDATNTLFTVASIIATIVLIFMINAVPILLGINMIFFTGILSFGLAVLCYILNKRTNVEFETSITNDNFTVSRILAETKRELLADFKIQECKRIAPTTADTFTQDKNEAKITLNATELRNYEVIDSNWYCLVEQDGTKFIVIFPFKEKMYKAFRRFNPRNTFFMRIQAKEEDEE